MPQSGSYERSDYEALKLSHKELLKAVHYLTYENSGRILTGINGDSDVTVEVGKAIKRAEKLQQEKA